MLSKYDIESFITDIITLVQDNLASKINSINTEKNDGYSISTIDTTSYFDDITDQVLNVNPFIYYTPVEITTEMVGPKINTKITLAISVVFDNNNQDGTIKKVLRYTRCLREIIQENYKKFGYMSRLNVVEFAPTNIQLNEGSFFKMGGIQVVGHISQ
jgi:hypothetical protein